MKDNLLKLFLKVELYRGSSVKITISVLGRFHLFYLAKQLQDHNFLARLITSYPKFEAVKYGINPENIIRS